MAQLDAKILTFVFSKQNDVPVILFIKKNKLVLPNGNAGSSGLLKKSAEEVIKEQANINANVIRQIGSTEFRAQTKHGILLHYLLTCFVGTCTLQQNENIEWLRLDQAIREIITQNELIALLVKSYVYLVNSGRL
jgi:hypothetical protein